LTAAAAPRSIEVMSTRVTTVQRLPIRLVLCYVAATVLVFVFGPFDWPIDNWGTLFGFLAVTMLALWLGFRWAVARSAAGTTFGAWRQVIVLGAAASVIILFVAAPIYTGRMPWEVLEALSDQGAAYRKFQDQLELTAGTRGPIALARILTWPLVLAALPLGILHWVNMNIRLRVLMLVTVGAIVISSILRSTDREIADLIAVAGGTGLVLFARRMVHEGLTLRALLRRYLVVIVAGIVVLGAAASLFGERKAGRYEVTAVCLVSGENVPSDICADFEHPWFGLLNERDRFTAAMAAGYFTQGYYGLALALTMDDFRSTWGLGNAPFAMAAYTNWTGDEELYKRSYTYRLRELNWSDQQRFSTMFPWIANDISFPMVPVLMLLIGAMFGASWRDAVFGRNDCAVVVFTILLIMMGYLPANSQITLVPDHLFALLTWICFWRVTRRRVAGPATAMLAPRHAI
jgi:hypothetical protein